MGPSGTLFAKAYASLSAIKKGSAQGDAELRRLVLLQFCNLLSVAVMISFAGLYALVDWELLWPAGLLSLACIPLYLLSALLNRLGWAEVAKVLFFAVLGGSVLVSTSLFIGKAPGMHFFFLLSAVLPLLLWPLSKPFWIFAIMAANLSGFLYIQFFLDSSQVIIKSFPAAWINPLNAMAIISVYTITIIILAFFQKRAEADALALNDRAQKMEELMRKYEELSNTDSLTGLRNRRAMLIHLEEERIRMNRNHTCFAILMVDIDLFKAINDRFGHEAGDHMLVEIGRTLRGSLREIDYVARWGGEEFLVLLPDASAEGSRIAAEKIRQKVESAIITWQDHQLRCTITVGIALFDRLDGSIDQTIRQADAALYQGKNSGRNQVVLQKR